MKIGFSTETESAKSTNTTNKRITNKAKTIAKKSIVDVYFEDRNLTCTYYNDMFDLKRGDIVYVDGKLEGHRGRVVKVSYNFKINLADYKKVIAVADTNAHGKFNFAGSHFFTTDKNALPYEQIRTWFKAPVKEDDEFISSCGDDVFSIDALGDMNIDRQTCDQGYALFCDDAVTYIELKNSVGRAIVKGSKSVYEVEFNFNEGDISGLCCSCYCAGTCKHEFAVMLQLKDILKAIEQNYPSVKTNKYIAAICKVDFFKNVIDTNSKGSIIVE